MVQLLKLASLNGDQSQFVCFTTYRTTCILIHPDTHPSDSEGRVPTPGTTGTPQTYMYQSVSCWARLLHAGSCSLM